MKKQSPAEAYGIDRDYLRRCKEMTPGQRLDWLAAAWEFANASKRKKVEKPLDMRRK